MLHFTQLPINKKLYRQEKHGKGCGLHQLSGGFTKLFPFFKISIKHLSRCPTHSVASVLTFSYCTRELKDMQTFVLHTCEWNLDKDRITVHMRKWRCYYFTVTSTHLSSLSFNRCHTFAKMILIHKNVKLQGLMIKQSELLLLVGFSEVNSSKNQFSMLGMEQRATARCMLQSLGN